MMAYPRSWSLVFIYGHWQEAFVISGFWGLVGGFISRMQICDQMLPGSFSSIYGLILSIQHFLFHKSSWSLFSYGREAYKMVVNKYIALYVLILVFSSLYISPREEISNCPATYLGSICILEMKE